MKVKIRALSLLLTLIILAVSVNITVAADSPTPTLTVSSGSTSPGETVDVTVSVSNNPGVVSMLLQLTYDDTVFEIVSKEESVNDLGNFGDEFHSTDVSSSPYQLYWSNGGAESDFTYNGDLVTVTFKVKDDAPKTDYAFTLSYDNTNYGIVNKALATVDFATVAGTITVKDPVVNVTGVSVSPSEVTIDIGESVVLSAAVIPDNATNKNVAWISSDDTVATVSGGKVTGVKKGNAVISAITEDGSKSAECAVTVITPVPEFRYDADSVKLVFSAPSEINAGSLISVDIIASTASDYLQKLSAFNFTLTYDTNSMVFLEMVPAEAFTYDVYEVTVQSEKVAGMAYIDDPSNTAEAVSVYKGENVLLATAKFLVLASADGELTVGLGSNSNIVLAGAPDNNGYTPDCAPITVSAAGNDISMSFIRNDNANAELNYKVLAEGTMIAVIESGTNEKTYTYGGKDFFYVEGFGGYAGIVSSDETEETLLAGLTVKPEPAVKIASNGDITNDGRVSVGDAFLLNAMLHNAENAYSDAMRLGADVVGDDRLVTTGDIFYIMKKAMGLI